MLTLLLLDHTPEAEREIVALLGEQDCQNFEILSAPSYARLDDILNDVRGDYLWILPPYHIPAQTQTIRKLNSVLTVQQPDMIIGSFAYTYEGKTKIKKQRHKKNLPDAPISSYIISRQSLEGLEENLFIDEIELTSLPRIIHCVNFPISLIDDGFIPNKYSSKLEWNTELKGALQCPFQFITSMMVLCGHGFDVVNGNIAS